MAGSIAKKPGNPAWRRGVSGNPGGRPRIVGELRELGRVDEIGSVDILGIHAVNPL